MGHSNVGIEPKTRSPGANLQSQWFPAQVLQQCRSRAQCALRSFLQSQRHDAFICPQRAHQVTKLPAHLQGEPGRGLEIEKKKPIMLALFTNVPAVPPAGRENS